MHTTCILLALGVLLASLTTAPAHAQGTPSLEELFARVDPAVVTLRTTSTVAQDPSARQLVSVGGLGSGVLIEGGLVLTASHVVQTADALIVEFFDGSSASARVIGSETRADIAVLKLESAPGSRVRPAPLGDSDEVRVGARVIVVGAPLGMTHTLTVGHVSARRRKSDGLRGLVELEFLQTDAAINKGNSGGPMFNLQGEVIGIVSHILTKGGGSDGMGFAVTSNIARKLLLEQHSFWSGVEGVLVSGVVARALNVPRGRTGYLVQQVARESPADKLGIKAGRLPVKIQNQDVILGGDIILEVLGREVGRDDDVGIREAVNGLRAGDTLTVTVLRAGETHHLELVLTPAMAGGS